MATSLTSYFAPPERASPEQLRKDIALVARHPIVDGLLRAASGLLVVLNEQRQIVAVNDAFLRALGIANVELTLGLRLGESVHCIHAHEMPAGCGTSRYCSTCGAVIAMVATLATDKPQERDCVATVEHGSVEADLFMKVRACTMHIEAQRFVLVFLQDMTMTTRLAETQRFFLYDMAHQIEKLREASDAIIMEEPTDSTGREQPCEAGEFVSMVHDTATQLSHDVAIQRVLLDNAPDAYRLDVQDVDASQLICAVAAAMMGHPACVGQMVRTVAPSAPVHLRTDPWLLRHILNEMLTNAMEATDAGDEIKLAVTEDAATCTFSVWNRQVVPDAIALRMFERHHSTKPGIGRGQGVYAIKRLGEGLLRGKVEFTSARPEGTEFRIVLPRGGPAI